MKSLENTLVVAPFDGVVENRSVKEGEQVAPGVPILRLTDSKVMKVKAGVPERYAADIKAGREASVRFNAYGIEDRSGKLIFVSSVIEPRSRTFEVELELANQDGLLKPEMVARVVVTKTVIDGALVIPVTAVIRDEEGTSVFVVLRNDGVPTAQQRRIELGVVSSGQAVVKSGLSAGDEVVVLGQTELTRGDIVRVTRRREAQARSP
ncbi:MAG: efflux RND transporter periplasmic adaptor subunit [Myxococcota bacterium]